MNDTPTTSALRPGTTLNNGGYTIVDKIGEGGFGITYRAVQNNLNCTVCIKEFFLAGHCVRDGVSERVQLQSMDSIAFEKYRQAFVNEARTLAGLHHPNIVEVSNVFDENGTSYMVMLFIEGRTIQSMVDSNGAMAYPEAVNYIAQVAEAVDYIHARNILHRDIKPDNIIVTADYRAILIDFGSAREFINDKTQAHTSILTHGYAPMEQYATNSRKGCYTDIYALGATLYFMLTGKVPLEATARITEQMVEPIRLNPEIPLEANRTILKAMQVNPYDRHQTVADFMDDLRNVRRIDLEEQKVQVQREETASPKNEGEDSPASRLRSPWMVLSVVLGALLLAGIVWYVVSNARSESAESHQITALWEKLKEQVERTMEQQAEADRKRAEAENRAFLRSQGLVDFGLPSGTLWYVQNEKGFFEYEEAEKKFGDRLPTKEQWDELKSECQWEWTGKGYAVIGSNGDTLSLPAAGALYYDGNILEVGSHGYYCIRQKNGIDNFFDNILHFSVWGIYFFDYSESSCNAFSVRLVQPKKTVVPAKEPSVATSQASGTTTKPTTSTCAPEKKEAPISSCIATQSKQGFDIIVGCYTSISTADQMCQSLKKMGSDSYIINRNGLYYVSMGSAASRTEADAKYNHLKEWYKGDISIKKW